MNKQYNSPTQVNEFTSQNGRKLKPGRVSGANLQKAAKRMVEVKLQRLIAAAKAESLKLMEAEFERKIAEYGLTRELLDSLPQILTFFPYALRERILVKGREVLDLSVDCPFRGPHCTQYVNWSIATHKPLMAVGDKAKQLAEALIEEGTGLTYKKWVELRPDIEQVFDGDFYLQEAHNLPVLSGSKVDALLIELEAA